MTIQEFISGVTLNITTKTQRNSITPGIVGGAFVNLANIVAAIPTGTTSGGTTGGTIDITAITDFIEDYYGISFINNGFTSFYYGTGSTLNEVPVGSTYTKDLGPDGTTAHLALSKEKLYAFYNRTTYNSYSKYDIINDFLGITSAYFNYPGKTASQLFETITKDTLPGIETGYPGAEFYFTECDVQLDMNDDLVDSLQILDSNNNIVFDFLNTGQFRQRGTYLQPDQAYTLVINFKSGANGNGSVSYYDSTGESSLGDNFNIGSNYSISNMYGPIQINIVGSIGRHNKLTFKHI